MAGVFEAKGLFYLAGQGGGVQPTNDYEDLTNKPQINGVELSGSKTSADLGITDNKAIEIASNTTVEGFSVPNPTAEELTAVYNAVVAGNSVQIVDSNDVYYQVLQADSVDDAINVEILYFSEMSLLYTLENETVSITSKKIGGSAKNVITLTGESGILTEEEIALVTDDTAVLEIVCDGEVFRLSNKDSTLTYRTYINTNCEASETVSFKVIYVQLNQEAVNYGAWTLEEVSAGGTTISSTTATLTVAGWSNKSQTVSVSGITATNTVWVAPAPASSEDYSGSGVICVSQGDGSLTFECTEVPTSAITVNIVYSGQ